MFWFLGHKACEILAPRPGIKPVLPALEGEVLTTGPSEKSQNISLFNVIRVNMSIIFAAACICQWPARCTETTLDS